MVSKIFCSDLFLSILSGLIIGLAYLPYNLGFLAYIGFVPIFTIWLRNNKFRNGIFGFVFGALYNLVSNYWIGYNSGTELKIAIFSLLLAVFYLAIYWYILGFVIGILKNKINPIIMFPFFIVTLEWFRGMGPLAFSWGNLALTQTDYITIIQSIEYGGTYIVSFIIISINLLFYFLLKDRRIIIFFIIVFIIFGLHIVGKARINSLHYENKSIRVAVIQPNIDPNKKWDYSGRIKTISFMDSLHTIAISKNPDIILFPETALPAYLRLNRQIRSKIQLKVDQSKIPILIGTVDRKLNKEQDKIYYNSSMYLQPDLDFEMYSKIHLVPFAEYDLIPNIFHPLEKLNLNIDRGVFISGNDFKIFKHNGINFSNLICFESSIPYISRQFIKNGADFITIQANDGWLGYSAGPYQHFELARLRAIENRVPIVRSSNTGISGLILPSGKVFNKIPIGSQAVFVGEINLLNKDSFYSIYGDIFAKICTAISLIVFIIRCVIKF